MESVRLKIEINESVVRVFFVHSIGQEDESCQGKCFIPVGLPFATSTRLDSSHSAAVVSMRWSGDFTADHGPLIGRVLCSPRVEYYANPRAWIKQQV
jgi:hypothetical protein